MIAADAKAVGYRPEQACVGGYTCAEAKQAGGMTCSQARDAGYTPQECAKGGFSLAEGRAAGYPYGNEPLWNGTYTPGDPEWALWTRPR